MSWPPEDMVGELKAKDKVGWVHTMKTYGEVETEINRFLNSVPDGDKWSSIYPRSRVILETSMMSRWKAEFHIMGTET